MRWMAISALALGLAIVLGGTAAGVVSAGAATYTITFTEVGLAKGTSWSVTFNSLTTSSKTATITFKAVPGGSSYYWSTSGTISAGTGIEYATSQTAAYMSVPSQTGQYIVFTKEFQVALTPSVYGAGYITPQGTYWFPAGSQYPISSGAYVGYAFTSWSATPATATFASKTAPSTVATIVGTGTITANFKSLGGKVTFHEVGLPTGTNWSLNFNGVVSSSTTSSISPGKFTAGYYSYSLPAIAISSNTRYVTSYPVYGSGYLYVPYTTDITVTFVKQYLLSFVVTPSASYGYTNPSTSAWVNNGSVQPISAVAGTSGYVFSAWSSNTTAVALASKSADSTTVTVSGPATLTATFVTGTQCGSCTAVFSEVGLPAGTSWGVTFNGSFYGTNKTTLSITKAFSGYAYWTTLGTVASSTPGTVYTTPQTYGSLPLPYATHVALVFTMAFQVSFLSNPTYLMAGVLGGYYSGYFPSGSVLPVFVQANDYMLFQKWSSSSKHLKLGNAKALSTTVTVTGSGSVTGNFRPLMESIVFHESGLANGSTWYVTFNGQTYYSTGTSLNITGVVAGNYGWTPASYISAGSAGVAYLPTYLYSQYDYTPYQTDLTVLYYKAYQVTLTATGKAGGSVVPSGIAWYPAGTLLAVNANNGTSSNFTAWSSTAAGLSIHATSASATYLTIGAAGTVSAKFV